MTEKANEEEYIRELNQKLKDFYGPAPEPVKQSGIDYLIETILSQNTNDINRDKAFKNLKAEFNDYKEIETCDIDRLTDVIRIAGLGPTKAKRIQGALKEVREENGEYSMKFMEEMSVDNAKKWLTNIPGIGPKTAAVILCFKFKKPIIPVDTHVFRISKRLGLVPLNASRVKAHEILNEKVPDDIMYEFHRLLITHGREHCKARNPTCEEGPLKEYCMYYREVVNGDKEPSEVP